MKRLFLVVPAFALMLSGCIETANGAPPTAAQAVTAVASAAASIADAAGVAPPSTVMTADVKNKASVALSAAWNVFNAALTVVDALNLTKGSPTALTVGKAEVVVQTALNTAQDAINAGDATKWTAAVQNAQTGLATISTALKAL